MAELALGLDHVRLGTRRLARGRRLSAGGGQQGGEASTVAETDGASICVLRGSAHSPRQAEASKANRVELVQESARLKTSVRDQARLEKQRQLAETLREKTEADEHGDDLDRKKNWAYTIEENDDWEKRLARKKRRADFEYHGPSTSRARA